MATTDGASEPKSPEYTLAPANWADHAKPCPASPEYPSSGNWADHAEALQRQQQPRRQRPYRRYPQHHQYPRQQQQRPQRYLRYVQTAVHEALQECDTAGKTMCYHDLKQRAIQFWEVHFSDKLAQWNVVHSMPLTEPGNRRRLPPFAKRLLEQSLAAFDTDVWCQALLLSHDPKVLFAYQTADMLSQRDPEASFYSFTQEMTQAMAAATQFANVAGTEKYLHFSRNIEPEPANDTDAAEEAGWTTVHNRRRRRQKYETLELAFPDMAWFYAFKIYCFSFWMHRSRVELHEASVWRNLSDSQKHHNRILDHVRTVVQIQSELNELLQHQQNVDYSQPIEWKGHDTDSAE